MACTDPTCKCSAHDCPTCKGTGKVAAQPVVPVSPYTFTPYQNVTTYGIGGGGITIR